MVYLKNYLVILLLLMTLPLLATARNDDWRLVWSDEFNTEGRLSPSVWNYEQGYVRNEEAQWYQPDNAVCKGGFLVIEARKERNRQNPLYIPGSNDWRKEREFIEYTSSSVTTAGKKEFLYGRFEVRARIPVAKGAWPAIWTLGSNMEWPSCGEIDIMEYYQIKGVPHILANAAWGTDKQWGAKWNSKATPYIHFTEKDPEWASKFHIWRMDWDEEVIKLYLDDELLNEIPLKDTVNGSIGKRTNPFTKPQYLLLNLAIGGINGGPIDESALPMKYEIDYVRVYQKEKKIVSGKVWRDTEGNVINAHGGGVLYHEGKYYWFGEHRPESGFVTEKGINCYSSTDLLNWNYEGVVLPISEAKGSDIEKGCIMERPKVIYNKQTGKFVMWFHLELKGRGYGPARAAVAVSDSPTGPYCFIRSARVNSSIYPLNMTKKEKRIKWNLSEYEKWWTPEWYDAVEKGMFVRDGKPYKYIGANFWYGGILASEGEGGNRERLVQELDSLKSIGIDNLRILVGSDGARGITSKVEPTLQTAPGVYNDTILAGLDFLLFEMKKRDMLAVLYLNNSWEWSGGYSQYLEWAGKGKAPVPSIDGWPAFMDYVKEFPNNKKAKSLFADYVKDIITRINRYTNISYVEDPTIMSWQIGNEPRAFSGENKEAFAIWMAEVSRFIKSLDRNHLVSTGSEGKHGCEEDLALFERIHADKHIDYMNIHIWPYNWGWAPADSLSEKAEAAQLQSKQYIDEHLEIAQKYGKPLVLEEFGYPRDGFRFDKSATTQARDTYYQYIFSLITDRTAQSAGLAGCNFWAWGGLAAPKHLYWQRGDDYTGDPAQEQQGLNSVFMSDSTTIAIIRTANQQLKQHSF